MLKLFNAAKKSDGLSLVEVIVAIAIGIVGTLGSYALLVSVHSARAENMELLQAQQEVRNIMERITREIRESSPEAIIAGPNDGEESAYIYFYTPRNAAGQFIINAEGEPVWQRTVSYELDTYSHQLYRYQYYMNYDDPGGETESFEVMSKNVEYISFRRINDMLTINLRTFTYNDDGNEQTDRSHAELTTTIKLRN